MPTTKFDLAVTMALHREGTLLTATLSSYDLAFEQLRKHGYSVQLIVTLDRCDATTLQVFAHHTFYHISDVTSVICDYGDLGLARNHGISLANAMYIATADGDDLISPNYLERSLTLARAEVNPTVFIPQFLFSFGSINAITIYPRCLSNNSLAWFDNNYGVSRIMAHHQVFDLVPYKALRDDAIQYAYEDWTFNSDCIAAGIQICHVPNTVLFYRRHERSITHANANIRTILRAQSSLFNPTTYLTHARMHDQASFSTESSHRTSFDEIYRASAEIREAFRVANILEPEIGPQVYRSHQAELVLAHVSSASKSYYYLCQILNGFDFADVFLVPSLDRSGAPRCHAHVMHSLYNIDPTRPILVVCGEPLLSQDSIEWLPPNALVIDCHELMDGLPSKDLFHVLVKLLQHIAPNARIHMSTSTFATELVRNQSQYLMSRKLFLYRFCDPVYNFMNTLYQDGAIVAFVRDFHRCFTAICYDSQFLLNRDRRQIPNIQCPTFLLNSQVSLDNMSVDRAQAKILPHNNSQVALLWASRFAYQKRLSLLSIIASRLQITHPNIVIHAYGGTLNDYVRHVHNTPPSNIIFEGAFGSFSECLVRPYAAFIYTSYFDGLPNVILEAIASGLIVIAPDVGGISEVVTDDITGFLVPSTGSDHDMADQYVERILRFINDSTRHANITVTAQNILRARFSPEAHRKAVADILTLVTDLHYT